MALKLTQKKLNEILSKPYTTPKASPQVKAVMALMMPSAAAAMYPHLKSKMAQPKSKKGK